MDTHWGLHRGSRELTRLAVGLCAFTLILMMMRGPAHLDNQNHTAGVWLSHAVDLQHGVLYRDICGSLGYGGTRYFPFYFVVAAPLLKAGVDPFVAGILLNLLSLIVLVIAAYHVLKSHEVPGSIASVLALAMLAPRSVQLCAVSIRGDILSSALNMAGLAFASVHLARGGGSSLALSAGAFVLAFATKFTTLYGMAATLVILALARGPRSALRFAAMCTGGILFLGILVHITSSGRAYEALSSCWLGGASFEEALRNLRRGFVLMFRIEPVGFVFLIVAVSTVWSDLQPLVSLLGLNLVLTGIVTSGIFLGPGTVQNHLVDLSLAAMLFLGQRCTQVVALRPVLVGMVTWLCLLASIDNHLQVRALVIDKKLNAQQLIRKIRRFDRPILSEDPCIPVMMGQPPYVLDPYMLRILRGRYPSIDEDFTKKLSSGYFSAVVIFYDARSKAARDWYEKTHFGKGFVQLLLKGYHRAESNRSYDLYLPGKASGPEPPANAPRADEPG